MQCIDEALCFERGGYAVDKDDKRQCVEECPTGTFLDVSDTFRRCVESCGERFVDDGPKCVDTCPDELIMEIQIYDSVVKRCETREYCNKFYYYVEGNKNAEALAEKYDKCVDECPPELPVHKDGEKQCMTCATATDNKSLFWLGEGHSVESCNSYC